MTVSPVVRRTAVLLLVTLLSTSLSHADVRQESRKARAAERYTNAVRLFLAEAWANVNSIIQKEGSSLDPFGQPKPEDASGDSSDNGASLDPFGGN